MSTTNLSATTNTSGDSTNFPALLLPANFPMQEFSPEWLRADYPSTRGSVSVVRNANRAECNGTFLVSSSDVDHKPYTKESVLRLLTILNFHTNAEYRTDTLHKFVTTFVPNHASEESLNEALSELAELDNYAKEEELTPPSPVAKKFACDILNKLTQETLHNYSVSLWEDGDVVIYSVGAGWRISIYSRANGGASLYVTSPDKQHDYESHYQLAQDMPISIVGDALKKIPA